MVHCTDKLLIVITITVVVGVVLIVVAVGVSFVAYRCVRCESHSQMLANSIFVKIIAVISIYVSLSNSVKRLFLAYFAPS